MSATSASPRTIVVTGGSRGIGRAIVEALAIPGSRVFFNYAAADDAAADTAAAVAAAGGSAHASRVDVSDEQQVQAWFAEVIEQTGRLDVLVNNAGITRDGLLVRMSARDWDAVLDTNLKGAFLCCKLAGKQMLRQRAGRIVNISSVVGFSGNPGQANYVASKAGIVGLTKAAARELASRGITVNAVAPGFIATDMTAGLTQKQQAALVAQIPLGRIGDPADVAAAVAFLASDQAGYITGQVLHVNGGMYC